jgi:hypothetical protein
VAMTNRPYFFVFATLPKTPQLAEHTYVADATNDYKQASASYKALEAQGTPVKLVPRSEVDHNPTWRAAVQRWEHR